LDEAFGFAVGLWPIRARAFQPDRPASGDRLNAMAAIVTPVVGQDARDAYAAPRKPGDGALEEGRRRGAGLIKEWAYAALLINSTGMAASHIAAADPFGALIAPTVFTSLTVASWALRHQLAAWRDHHSNGSLIASLQRRPVLSRGFGDAA
jgi:hypothetical protein